MIRTVLMTADAVGGVWTYSLDLAHALKLCGTHVVLAVMGPKPSSAQIADAGSIEIRHGDYKLEWMDQAWSDVDLAGDWLLSLEREVSADVIHLNGYVHGSIDWRAPKVVVAHSCVLSWWEAVHRTLAPPEWDEYRARVSAGIHAADLVIAPSQAMLAAIEKNYGALRSAKVIPNGRDARAYRPATKEPFILTAGRFWDQAKNLSTLDGAAAALEWPVYAAGEGGIPAGIHPLGRLSSPDLREWYSRASIFTLPARYEPFGLSILEAALSGCALVLGDIPSLRENWEDAALFAPPDDTNALASQLRSLIHSAETRRRYQIAACDRAQQFTVEKMAEAYLDCYAALRCRSHPATAFKS
jgi:glycogen(starch) synthase